MNPDAAFPFVNFCMTVRERKASSVVMKRAAIVHCVCGGGNNCARGVVDGPGIIIEENPDIRSGTDGKIALPGERHVRLVRSVRMAAIEPRAVDLDVATVTEAFGT